MFKRTAALPHTFVKTPAPHIMEEDAEPNEDLASQDTTTTFQGPRPLFEHEHRKAIVATRAQFAMRPADNIQTRVHDQDNLLMTGGT